MSDYPMLISNKLHSFRNFKLQSYKKAVSFQDIVFVFVATRYGCLFNLSGRIKKTSAYFGENMLMFFYFLYKIQKLLYDLF